MPDEIHWTLALDDIKEFFDESPDRGIAISLPAIIDNRLTSILRAIMLPEKKLLDEMFQPSGALGNFKTKINLVYVLRLINKEFYEDLCAVNKIRNYFAHKLEIKELEQTPIQSWIKGMHIYRTLIAMSKNPPKRDKAADFGKALMRLELDSMRNCFRSCVRLLILRLNDLERTLIADAAKARPPFRTRP